jgi:acetyltransferase-like isoleucine patch superfamily enzyme
MIKNRRHFIGTSKFSISKNARIHESCDFDTTADITIKEHVIISEGVCFITHKHNCNNTRKPFWYIQDISKFDLVIERDVFIGMRAIIICVGRIGEGAIIGAGSVLTKEVGDFEIWAGSPAVKIGVRNEECDFENI